MNFSSEYEIDAEHEVDSTPPKDEESAVLSISAKKAANQRRMNCAMQKGNNGKLRTRTANKATYDWPWRAAKKPEC